MYPVGSLHFSFIITDGGLEDQFLLKKFQEGEADNSICGSQGSLKDMSGGGARWDGNLFTNSFSKIYHMGFLFLF